MRRSEKHTTPITDPRSPAAQRFLDACWQKNGWSRDTARIEFKKYLYHGSNDRAAAGKMLRKFDRFMTIGTYIRTATCGRQPVVECCISFLRQNVGLEVSDNYLDPCFNAALESDFMKLFIERNKSSEAIAAAYCGQFDVYYELVDIINVSGEELQKYAVASIEILKDNNTCSYIFDYRGVATKSGKHKFLYKGHVVATKSSMFLLGIDTIHYDNCIMFILSPQCKDEGKNVVRGVMFSQVNQVDSCAGFALDIVSARPIVLERPHGGVIQMGERPSTDIRNWLAWQDKKTEKPAPFEIALSKWPQSTSD